MNPLFKMNSAMICKNIKIQKWTFYDSFLRYKKTLIMIVILRLKTNNIINRFIYLENSYKYKNPN